MAKNWKQPLANSQREAEVLGATIHKELNPVNKHVRDGESGSFPNQVLMWPALADAFKAALWVILTQKIQLSGTDSLPTETMR